MDIHVLGASGGTGRELTRQAVQRGHRVFALSRSPAAAPSALVIPVAADVRDPASMAAALSGAAVVVSGLGNVGAKSTGALLAGARAVAASGARAVWLSGYGTGRSAAAAGPLTRAVLRLALGADELADKAASDAVILAAGGTVLHAGPLSDGPRSARRRTVALADAPSRLFPARVSRATAAAAMLDEAERPRHAGAVAVPLEH